eukprot:UN03468
MEDSLNQRSDKEEIIFRGIVKKEYLSEDVRVAEDKRQQQRISVKRQMNQTFGNRPSKSHIQKLHFEND